MTLAYVDTSALARLYLTDEPDARVLEVLLLGTDEEVATSELSDVELARAVKAAERAGRLANADRVLQLVRHHVGSVIGLVPLRPETALPAARTIVLEHRVRTLDALHLAVALELRESHDEDMMFITRDSDQAAAARALGFTVP